MAWLEVAGRFTPLRHWSTPGGDLRTLAACRRYIARVMSGAWWQAYAADVIQVDVANLRRGVDHLADAGRCRAGDRSHHLVRFSTAPGARTRIVVLHELAHCAEPKRRMPVDRRGRYLRGDYLPLQLPEHGSAFATAFLGLVEEQLGSETATELAGAFASFDVTPLDDDAFSEAIEADRVAARCAAALAQQPPLPEPDGGWVVPEWIWGDSIEAAARRITVNGRRRVHPVGVARAVSEFVPCSRQDLDAIFASRVRPDDPRLNLIAFYLCVMAGIDTIWMQTSLGLARWTVGDGTLELDDLEAVNPEWVATGRRLNAALEQAHATGRLE